MTKFLFLIRFSNHLLFSKMNLRLEIKLMNVVTILSHLTVCN